MLIALPVIITTPTHQKRRRTPGSSAALANTRNGHSAHDT